MLNTTLRTLDQIPAHIVARVSPCALTIESGITDQNIVNAEPAMRVVPKIANSRATSASGAILRENTQQQAPTAVNAGVHRSTSLHVASRYWRSLVSSRAPIAREKVDVSPVDIPTHTAIMTSSKGYERPIAATEASPRNEA